MNTNPDLSPQQRRALCKAFASRLPYAHCINANEVVWRDASLRPNVFHPLLYKHRHPQTRCWSPDFIRLAVNFMPPWRYRRGFWETGESFDTTNPNSKIEVTTLPEEAAALAIWMPLWLAHREGVLTESQPEPPPGLDGLLTKNGGSLYSWSEAADKVYESWMAEQKELTRCH